MPHEADELMHVVGLRRVGKKLGCEKIILKQDYMQMQFVSNLKQIVAMAGILLKRQREYALFIKNYFMP